MEHTLAVTLGNKLPPNSGMAKEFKLRTKEALVNGLDTVKKALTRIKILISEKREHSRQSQLIGPDSYLSVVDEKDRQAIRRSSTNTDCVRPSTFEQNKVHLLWWLPQPAILRVERSSPLQQVSIPVGEISRW